MGTSSSGKGRTRNRIDRPTPASPREALSRAAAKRSPFEDRAKYGLSRVATSEWAEKLDQPIETGGVLSQPLDREHLDGELAKREGKHVSANVAQLLAAWFVP